MRPAQEEENLKLRITDIHREAEKVVSLRLARDDGGALPNWAPGAHVDLHLPGNIIRQYSLCGSPRDQHNWRVSVLLEEQSRGGSIAVHDLLREGDLIQARGPRNNFPLAAAESYIFIAGGIGITPLLPMIEEAEVSGSTWSLVYGGRSASSMAFLAELEKYGQAVVARPHDVHGLLDLPGLLGRPQPNTHVYCCGPAPLLAAVEDLCQNWPPGSLHVEHFSPKVIEPAKPSAAFEVKCDRSCITVAVPIGTSILEAVREAGVAVPSSCQEGTCGTCETDVLDGVPEHRDSVLSDEEKADNDTMMICVGRSLSPVLTLDL